MFEIFFCKSWLQSIILLGINREKIGNQKELFVTLMESIRNESYSCQETTNSSRVSHSLGVQPTNFVAKKQKPYSVSYMHFL